MIKRIALILLVGALAVVSFAGTRQDVIKKSVAITGHATANDSTAADTFALFTTNHYANRYWITIDFDSVVGENSGHQPATFGLRDSVFAIIKAEYAGQWITLDSTEDTLKDNTELTLNFTSGAGDTLYNYGEQLWLIIRIADTVGATEDSVHTFNFQVRSKHSYSD